MDLVLVGVGGFFGAIARRTLDLAISERVEGAFPFGTLVINLSGSFLLGLLFAWAIERDVLGTPDISVGMTMRQSVGARG